MTRGWQGLVALGVCLGMAGCVKAQMRLVEMPRVDQALTGNRGYLKGAAPIRQDTGRAKAARKATRQVIMTDIELPTREELWRRRQPVGPGAQEPAGRETRIAASAAALPQPAVTGEAASLPAASLEETFEGLPPPQPVTPTLAQPTAPLAPPSTYTVQKGDTLEKIAKKVYGDARRWPRIYQANRQALTNPNRVYPGQELTIPQIAEPAGRASDTPSAETIK